jgi:arylformamidase
VTLIDISVAYSAETPPWPGDTPYQCGWAWDMATGASVNVGRVTTSWHVGTHADAPLHVLRDGSPSEALPLEAFRGPATVVDVTRELADGTIGAGVLEGLLGDASGPCERLLLRTGRSVASGSFPDAGWPTLAPDAVAWLISRGLRLLGTDAPSVDARSATDLTVHRTLFAGGAYVVENLSLAHVQPGRYRLTAFPVLVAGADAAPLRAVLEPLPG